MLVVVETQDIPEAEADTQQDTLRKVVNRDGAALLVEDIAWEVEHNTSVVVDDEEDMTVAWDTAVDANIVVCRL